jgi:hypothetical protein
VAHSTIDFVSAPADNHLSFPTIIQLSEGTSMKLLRPGGSLYLPHFLLLSVVAVATTSLPGCIWHKPQLSPPKAPSITGANNTTFVQGVAGADLVTATGVPAPTITESGALPDGVTFSDGLLSGTPTETGVFQLTLTAQNGVPPNATETFTLTVASPEN